MRIKTVQAGLERLLAASERRATAVFVAACAIAVLGAVLIARLSFDPNVLRLLPREAPSVRALERFLVDFGSLDHLYVVFESPDPIGGHADLVDAYVDELRRAPEVESVDAALFEAGKDWTYLYDRELYLLGPRDTDAALSRLHPPALDEELAHARELLQMPSGDIKTMVQQDPLGMLTLLRNRFARQKGFVSFDPTQEGYVSPDGLSRLVMVKPKGAPFDTEFCKALFRRLAEIETAARAAADDGAGATAVKIFSAGAYRVALEAESVIKRESILNSAVSLILLLVIVIAVFRTPWMLVYGTLPMALAAVLALGIAGVTLGRLSPATSGSAAMLFGLGIDGVVLLFMRYLEEREAGAALDTATRRMSGTALAIALGQVTTAATFFALLFIDFPTLNDLGGLVGVGILLSCVFTLVLLPALLSRNRSTHGRTLTVPWLGDFVERHARAIVIAGTLATLVFGAAATGMRVDMSLERLQAKPRGVDLEKEVASRFSLPNELLLVVQEGPDVDPLVDVDARIAETFSTRLPDVAVSGISLVLPPSDSQRRVAERIRAAGSTADAAQNVREGSARAGFRPEAFEPFLERLPRLLDADARITHAGLVEHGLEPIVSRFIAHREDRYSAVTYLYPPATTDIAAIEATLHAVDPRLQLSGLPAINRELAARFPREFVKGAVLGTIVVALLIYGAFRTVRHTLLALVPTAIGFTWSAGILALTRVELDLFSMFAAVTCIGIAVNYGIYVLQRYVDDGGVGVRNVLSRTGAAIMIACTTALVGFGTLINSSYEPLRTFGLVSSVLLLCSVFASLLLLPALLIQLKR